MTWVRLDDGFAEHPKMEAAGPLGLALHVAAICYCGRHLTDGFVPASKVPRLLDLPAWRKVVDSLVDAGAWDEVDGGWRLHDYLDYQPSRAEVAAGKAAKADASMRGNHKRWHIERGKPDPDCPICIAEGIAEGIAGGIADRTTVGIPPSHPIPSHRGSLQQHSRSQAHAIAAAAAEIVARRRDLPRLAATKERPQRWLDAAVAGIERDLTAHPEFGRLMHDGADPEAFADLLEPSRPLAVVPHEPDPDRPLGSTA